MLQSISSAKVCVKISKLDLASSLKPKHYDKKESISDDDCRAEFSCSTGVCAKRSTY